jgi:hypothetical protein
VGTDTFNYIATDGQAQSNVGTVTIQVVSSLNTPPVATNDNATTLKGTTVNIAVLANDADANGDPLSVSSFTQPANGTVTFANGIASYAPRLRFTGTDTFTYIVTDGQSVSNVATVTVQVTSKPPRSISTATLSISKTATLGDDPTVVADYNSSQEPIFKRPAKRHNLLHLSAVAAAYSSDTRLLSANLLEKVLDEVGLNYVLRGSVWLNATQSPLQSLGLTDGPLLF